MNKLILTILLSSTICINYVAEIKMPPTKACVTIIGGIIKTQNDNINKKYPRKNCPVCKGKGWYISGDGIKKIDCGYCEPENTLIEKKENNSSVIIRR